MFFYQFSKWCNNITYVEISIRWVFIRTVWIMPMKTYTIHRRAYKSDVASFSHENRGAIHYIRVRARTEHELILYWPVTNIVIRIFMIERCRTIFFVFISLKATHFINVINVHYKRFRSYSYFLYSISLNGVILV